MDFLEPWYALAKAEGMRLELELQREVKEGHVLHGLPVRAVARRQDQDEVLYAFDGKRVEVAEVHLTWNEEPKTEWPRTTIYSSLQAWAKDKMAKDNQFF